MTPIRTYPNRTFVYKRARLVNATRSLSDMLRTAMQDRDTVESRLQVCDDDAERFINQWKDQGSGFWVGTLFEYTKGEMPVGFVIEPASKELSVSVLAQLDDKTHVLQSALHFGVLDNHVVLMPTNTIRTVDFQNYINWLLTDVGILIEDGTVVLSDELAPELREHDWKRVKGITLRSRLARPKLPAEQEPKNATDGILRNAVKLLARNRDIVLGSLSAAEAIALERVAVSMTIRYEGRTETLDTTLLDHVASVLKDDPTAHFDLTIEGYGQVKANQVRVTQKKSIAHDDKRPVFSVVAEKMHAWLREKIESGRVRP